MTEQPEVELVSTPTSSRPSPGNSRRQSRNQSRNHSRRTSSSTNHNEILINNFPTSDSSINSDDESDDGEEFHIAHSPSMFQSLPRSHSLYIYVVTPLLTAFFIFIPLIIALISYLNFLQVLICWIIALFLPCLLYHTVWIQMSLADREAALSLDGELPIKNQKFHRAWRALICVHSQWQHEVYQLLLTLLSCSVWITYTYHLSYDNNDSAIPNDYDYDLSFSDDSLILFFNIEYFLIVTFSMDYLIGFWSCKDKWEFSLSYYRVIDLICFTGVAYLSFTGHGFAPVDAIYSYYLLQGSLRFMRFRRALKSLDSFASSTPVIRNGRRLPTFRIDNFIVRIKFGPREASRILVIFRVFLYFMSSAALVLALEFPCAGIMTDNPSQCYSSLQSFHLCVYFIVVTFSTVGYGDIACGTSLGRMAMTLLIIGAIVQIPDEIQMWNKVAEETKKEYSNETNSNENNNENFNEAVNDNFLIIGRIEDSNERKMPDVNINNGDVFQVIRNENNSQNYGTNNNNNNNYADDSKENDNTNQNVNVDNNRQFSFQIESKISTDLMISLALKSPLHAWAIRTIESRHSSESLQILCQAAGINEKQQQSQSPAINLVNYLLGEPT